MYILQRCKYQGIKQNPLFCQDLNVKRGNNQSGFEEVVEEQGLRNMY